MTFEEYVRAVDRGEYPPDPRVILDPPVLTPAGGIWNLAFGKFEGAALIESLPHSVRSNHYHRTDWHYLVVMAGSVDYYWREVGDVNEPRIKRFKTSDVFFTPPMVEHALYFPEHTVLVSISKNARRHDDHEADLVRIKLVEIVDDEIKICK